ncbi:TPA: glycosyltransferase family 2 protein, partial [Escherichia coli]
MNNTDKLNKKVSVYISTHNRLERLKRAIQSVLNQEYSNLELLVCDDASNDGTK